MSTRYTAKNSQRIATLALPVFWNNKNFIMAKSIEDWRRHQEEMIERHAAEIKASSGGAKEREIKDLIQAYEVKLRASHGTEFVNLQVELTRKIAEVERKAGPSIEDVKLRHQRELEEHLLLYSQLVGGPLTSSPRSRPSSAAPKGPPSNQSNKRLAERPLAEVRNWATSLELHGSRVRWMLRTWKSPESKRQRIDNTGHTSHETRTPAKIKMISYEQVRRNALEKGHWDTIVEWPTSSRQFWVLFCVQHNMHFKTLALQAGAKHINGSLHGALSKDFPTALVEIGYYIPNCNEELARVHNAEVQRKLEEGYRPSNHFAGKKKTERLTLSDFGSPKPPQLQPSGRTECRPIANPKPFHVYYCYFEKQYWACLILGWDAQIDACRYKSLEETRLLQKHARPPKCYNHTSKKILGWAQGYEDGGPNVDLREFPIMYFDGENHVGWAPARDLSKLDLTTAPEGEEYPEASYNEARQWIATAAGCNTWEEYRASSVNLRKPIPAPMSEGQNPALGPANTPSEYTVSDFDEVLEGLRVRGGDDTDDGDYQDDGRGSKGGRPPSYVFEHEDEDEWAAKYNTRKADISATKSLDTQICNLGGKDRKPRPGHEFAPIAAAQILPPTNSPPNGIRDRSSEPRASPATGAPASRSVPSERPVASMTAWRTKSARPGSSEPLCRPPHLQALVTSNLSQNRMREVKSQPPEAPRRPGMKTATADGKLTVSPTISVGDQRTLSAGSMYGNSGQRRASASSMTTTMSGEAATATPSQSLITSPVSAAATPAMLSASPTTSIDARPKGSGQPRVFEITKYADATRRWQRADREEACVKLCTSEDDKTVATSDERICIAIDPQLCMKPHVQTIEGREGMSVMTLPQVSGEVITMVFDRSRGGKMELGKIQARNFVRWLQAQNEKLR